MTAFCNKNTSDEGSKVEWITPKPLIDALGGPFDLDPCAPVRPPYQIARQTFNIETDGLKREWPRDAFVFLNPPYDRNLNEWLKRLKNHPGGGIALIFARTDTKYFRDHVWTADALLFLDKRITFWHVSGEPGERNSGAPSVLVAYGQKAVERLRSCGLSGQYIDLGANRVKVSEHRGYSSRGLFDQAA
jgi:hypothetical protein